MNEEIIAKEVRLIDQYGGQAGITSTEEALKMAQESGFDLVEIAPMAKPPVCKIIDWGKHLYQESKKKQVAKAKKIEVKGIRIRPATGEGDLDFKSKQAKKFLEKGKKVKVEILLRGREKAFSDQAREKIKLFIDKIDYPIRIEQDIKRQFNGFNVLIAPESSPN